MGGSAIVNPFGAYLAEPVFHKETLVLAELDLADRIVAKNVFDCMGHYARWDVVSLQLREQDFGPTASAAPPRRISLAELESLAQRHQLPPEKVKSLLREIQAMAVEVVG
jgi:hypothetical protein